MLSVSSQPFPSRAFSESFIEIKIKLNFYFHASLSCLKRFFVVLQIVLVFFSLCRIWTSRVKAFLVLRYLNFCLDFLVIEKNGLIGKTRLNSKFMISQHGKDNQTMKFGHLIEYNKVNIFLQNSCRKSREGRQVPDLFLICKKALYETKANGLQLNFSIIIIIIINRCYLTHPLYMVLRSYIIFTQYSHKHT